MVTPLDFITDWQKYPCILTNSMNQYRTVQYGSCKVGTHRIAFFNFYGYWPEPQCCHRCDNRACKEPRHLFDGTQADNTTDAMTKNRLRTISVGTRERVKDLLVCGVPMKQIARHLDIGYGSVHRISREF